MKQFLERNSGVISWISGIGVPLALVITGWLAVNSVESSKLDSEYVRIALSILSASPPEKKDSDESKAAVAKDLALRNWAVRLLDTKAPQKFSNSEQAALLYAPTAVARAFASEAGGSGEQKAVPRRLIVADDQEFVALATDQSEPRPMPLGIPRPSSWFYSARELTVKIWTLPSVEFITVHKIDGPKLAVGDILNVFELESLQYVDRTGGAGGVGRLVYGVSGVSGSVDVTVTIRLNPAKKQ